MWCPRSRHGSATWHGAASSGKRRTTTCTACESRRGAFGSEETLMGDETAKKKGGVFQIFRDIVYGMSSHEMTRHAVRTRASMEHLFILITMGDLLGIPFLPPYYSLRLLPYVTPQIAGWKRRMLRERDITDVLG